MICFTVNFKNVDTSVTVSAEQYVEI